MPRGLNRSGDFRNGTPITLPHEFGTPITLPHEFGNPVTQGNDPRQFGNPVTWPTPDPAHFGNIIAPPSANAPVFAPPAGEYATAQDVTITSAGSNGIFYTLDGSTPTPSSTPYSGPVHIATSETLKAIATAAGLANSPVTTGAYIIDAVPVPMTPLIRQSIAGPATLKDNTPTIVFNEPVTTGAAVFLYVQMHNTVTDVVSFVDDAGNSYTILSGPDVNASVGTPGSSAWLFACLSVVGNPQTLTMTQSTASFGYAAAVEVLNFASVDVTKFTAITVAAPTWNGGNLTPANDNDLLLAFGGQMSGQGANNIVAGSGWLDVTGAGENSIVGQFVGVIKKAIGAAAATQINFASPNNDTNGMIEAVALTGITDDGRAQPIVTTVKGDQTGSASTTTSPVDTTGATLIIVGTNSFSTPSGATVTDNMSNTYTPLTLHQGSQNISQLWYCINPTVGAGHTVTYNCGVGGGALDVSLSAFKNTGAFVGENGATDNSGTGVIASGNVTPAEAGDLVFTSYSLSGNTTTTPNLASNGFTILGNAASFRSLAVAFRTAPSTSAIGTTWSGSTVNVSAAIACFKKA